MWRKAEMVTEESTKRINETKTGQSIDHFFELHILFIQNCCDIDVSNEQWDFFVRQLWINIAFVGVESLFTFYWSFAFTFNETAEVNEIIHGELDETSLISDEFF